ncbi:hypothetical protein [Chryseobacterium fistulae]|uniref:Uncharacterized protein n=1 Tax=Chryseobacterium fistulae TaxID=2675058 RepID=A0A6N4XUM7_9FLAO|nr:hypothetical protein [Chryseobacterium fistulae]CAA7392550.1 hypothetical protein CHRY9393_03271 [Chryseobacterium fistulae]
MNLNDMTMYLLGEYLIDSADDLNEFYSDSMELLRGVADEKEIEFDEYYRTKWGNSADTLISFDEIYFSDSDKRDLYVFLSAQVDDDIYTYLDYVWNSVYHEKLSNEILKEKVQDIVKKGVKF